MRFSRNVFTVALLAAALVACDSSMAPEQFLPRKGVEIVVDSAVYHLQTRQPGSYLVDVAVTLINGSDHDVYLAQDCGYWNLQRADGSSSWLELGAYSCAAVGGGTRPAPLPVAAGTRYTKTFRLFGSLQPQARPRITLADNIGTVQFRYIFTDPLSTAMSSVHSASFTVLPPA